MIGPDGNWKLPAGAPAPTVAPFDEKKAKEHQAAWAKYLGMPVEITNSIGMRLVLIPPGEYGMGSPKEVIEDEMLTPGTEDWWYKSALPGEGPLHRVQITKPFYLGEQAVTQEEYQRVMGTNPSDYSATGHHKDEVRGQDTKRLPVENVSWDHAAEFGRKLSEMPEEKALRRIYRLPSEAQWEYACRAGTTGRWYFSPASAVRTPREEKKNEEKMLSDYGWFDGNSGGRTHAVGRKQPSPWGLYDMYGNVWQWCQDWYDQEYYAELPADDPAGPLVGLNRVCRGGNCRDSARGCRSAVRNSIPQGHESFGVGFRVSVPLPDKMPQADRERHAAEWVLKLGGTLKISVNGREIEVKALKELPNEQFVVVEIWLTGNEAVTSESLENLAGLTSLRSLGLLYTKAAGSGLRRLKGLKGLRTLELSPVADDQLVYLSDLTGLKALNFLDSQITDAGLDQLKEFNQLENLNLWGNPVTGIGLSGLTKLKTLSLTGPQVTDDSLRGLSALKSLENLTLRGTSIKGPGLEHLSGLDNLTGLCLADAPLEGPGLEHLKGLKKLRALDLYCTRLTGAGLKYLQGFTELEDLNLAGTRATDTGLATIATLSNLRNLALDATAITDTGMKELGKSSNLRRLGLGDTNITDAGLTYLKPLLQLNDLNLNKTGVTDAGVKELQKSLPKLTIHRTSAGAANKPTEPAVVHAEPIVPAKPVPLDLKPDAKAWDLKPGSPLNPASLVLKPAAIKGLRSWTVETCASRLGWSPDWGVGAGQLSPDEQLYATGGHDGVIRFLDPATGKLRLALVNPEVYLTALAWSPDSAYVAVGCAKGAVDIWNVAKGTLVIGPSSSSTNRISSLAWSPDGTLLAVARNGESAVVLWDVREARERPSLQEPDDANRSVNFLAWSADGKHLMATTDLAVRIWDVAAARLIRTLDPQTPKDSEQRRAAAWSPDGRRVALLHHSGIVKFFDSTYKLVLSADTPALGGASEVAFISWSPDGRHLASARWTDCLVLNTASGLGEFSFGGPTWGDGGSALSWSKDSTRLICTHKSGTVTMMNAVSGKALWQLVPKLPNDGWEMCVSSDGRQYATAGFQDRLYTWDAVQGSPVHNYGPIFPGGGQVAWSKDGRLAAAGGWSSDTGGRVWDAGEPAHRISTATVDTAVPLGRQTGRPWREAERRFSSGPPKPKIRTQCFIQTRTRKLRGWLGPPTIPPWRPGWTTTRW